MKKTANKEGPVSYQRTRPDHVERAEQGTEGNKMMRTPCPIKGQSLIREREKGALEARGSAWSEHPVEWTCGGLRCRAWSEHPSEWTCGGLRCVKGGFVAAPGQNTPQSGHVAAYTAAPGQNTSPSGHVAAKAV